MMGISRDLSDLARTGHGCHFVIGVKATQHSVFVNGKPALRMGDPCLPHTIPVCCPLRCVPHPAVVNMGSFKVFAKGIPVARFLDSTDMGMLIMGSFNVHAG
jgi:uncharacterized Zn-binding protein involved in type VI secretion|tara:strand:+ start:45 stop:350 length:306 start_codon:yes stop_codon:yes gene_type:complete